MKGVAYNTLFAAFVLSSLCISHAENNFSFAIVQKISEFIAIMGWTTVKIVCSPQDKQCVEFSVKLQKQANKVTQSTVIITKHGEISYNYNTSLIIFLPPNINEDKILAKSMIDLMKTATAYTSLVIAKNEDWKSVIDIPLGFYHFNRHGAKVIKVIVSRKPNSPQAFQVHEDSRLQTKQMDGAHLHAVTMSYEPSISVGGCEPDEPCQEVTGFSYDLLQALAIEANFTFSVYEEQSGLWGTVPREVNGKVYANATGIIKEVMEGKNDLPVCSWVPTSLRIPYVDFTFSFHEIMSRCFANVNQVSKSEWKFMLNPMTKKAWLAIIGMFILIVIFVHASKKLGGKFCLSHKLALAVGGVCCTILLSFYGSAQTMFLASEMQPPFNTILDGLKYNQHWKFILAYGDENMFINMFAHLFNDPGMEWAFEQAEKFRNNPIELATALGMLNEGRYYVLTTSNRVTSVLDDASLSALSVFCHSPKTPHGYMLPKNSPFKKAINHGLSRMRNIGVLKMLERMTRSAEEETKFGQSKLSHKGIDLLQVSLMLYAGVGIVICVLLLVICEKYLFKMRSSIGRGQM